MVRWDVAPQPKPAQPELGNWPALYLSTRNLERPGTPIMAHLNKILPMSPSRQHPSELEISIASAIYDLETNTADMRSALRPLQFVQAKEVSSLPMRLADKRV